MPNEAATGCARRGAYDAIRSTWTVRGPVWRPGPNVRISAVHRLTNDLDTVSRDQTSLVEILAAEPDVERLEAAKLRIGAAAARLV